MKANYSPFLVFSVSQSALSGSQNIDSALRAGAVLRARGIKFENVRGVYKGEPEASFLVDASHIDTVRELTVQHLQESILLVHNDRHAELVDPRTNKVIKSLGQFVQLSLDDIKTLDAYTQTENGDYWGVK